MELFDDICVEEGDGKTGNFFFSSRRRHTRCLSDWSSDVCSSDLKTSPPRARSHRGGLVFLTSNMTSIISNRPTAIVLLLRSEERRVGKECRSGWSPDN